MYYFYVPTRLQKEINDCNQPKIQRVLRRPEKPLPELSAAFTRLNNYVLEKIKTPSGPRFVWQIETRDNISLLVLRLYLSHGSGDYEKYKKFDGNTLRKNPIPSLSKEESDEVAKEFDRLLAAPANSDSNQLPNFSDAEKQFLSEPLQINHEIFFETVYENESWISFINELEDNHIANYCSSIKEVIKDKISNDEYGWIEIPYTANSKADPIIAYRQPRPGCSGGETDWILLGVLSNGQDPKEKFKSYFDENNPTARCRRVYPATFLEDLDNWQKMEQDPNSSFILSEEESSLVAGDPNYPLFLSGRAGSGKSTVLQYLFAEIILRYIKCSEANQDAVLAPPLYISYSENLIKNAKKLTESLFSNNHAYKDQLEKMGMGNKVSIAEVLNDGIFCSFQKLVLQSLAESSNDIIQNRFNPDTYISFTDFKKLWNNRFGKLPEFHHLGPERCWHVIHTYIKGWDSRAYLTPEEYSNIGRDNKTVSLEGYTKIYNKVWKDWYRNITETERWDDLDLVRYCLNPSDKPISYVTPRFSAIFCDESQDFTRVEIEYILRSSIFSNRKFIKGDSIGSLPFAFAGDEFQTLSPTGFSWDSIRSSFTEKLADVLKVNINSVTPPEPRQLQKNYRSTAPIVRLGNLLQLLRETRFNHPSKPQETYFTSDGAPVYFLPNNDDVWDKMKQENMILIVPADEGQSIKDYILHSSLKDKIDFNDLGASKNITIFNPSQAKGLDFPNVAIYGFGDDLKGLSLDKLISWFESDKKEETSEDIELKYQLNNIYVAVTRAKSHLYIIGDKNDCGIWEFALHGQNQEKLQDLMFGALKPGNKANWSKDNVGLIVEGQANDISNDNSKDFLSALKDMENDAKVIKDKEKMIQAATRYSERKDAIGENRCLAMAAEIDGKYKEAGDFFAMAKLPIDAANMYWKAIASDNAEEMIVAIKAQYDKADKAKAEHYDKAKGELATQIQSAKYLSEIKSCLVKISNQIDPTEHPTIDSNEDQKYVHLINLLLKRLEKIKIDINAIKPIVNILKPALDRKLPINIKIIGDILYTNEAFEEYVSLCENTNKKGPKYYRAKIKLSTYPDNVTFYQLADWEDWPKRLYSLFIQSPTIPIKSDKEAILIARAVADNSEEISTLREWVARGLSIASHSDFEIRKHLLDGLKRLKIEPDNSILEALDALRLKRGTIPTVTDKTPRKIAETLSVATEIVRIASGGIDLSNISTDTRSSYFDSHFQSRIHGILSSPMMFAIGNRLEHHGIHIVAVRFYEWAESKSSKKEDKKLFKLLRLRSLEQKNGENSLEERRALDLEPIEDINTAINRALQKVWERIYKYSIEIYSKTTSPELVNSDLSSPEDKSELGKSLETTHIMLNEPRMVFDGSFGEFDIRYNFSKKKLAIMLHSDQDVRLSVRNGKITADEMSVNEDGRICVNEMPTEIALKISEAEIRITSLYPDGSPTGVYISFEI